MAHLFVKIPLERSKPLAQAHWFNENLRTYQHEDIKEATSDLMTRIYEHSKPKRERRAIHLLQLEVLILNLFEAQKHSGFFVISKSAGHYSFVEAVSFRVLVGHHLKHLRDMGFLKEYKGFNSPQVASRTRYELLLPALEWLKKWQLIDSQYLFCSAETQSIHLKNAKKQRIPLPAGLIIEAEAMGATVQLLNQMLKYTFVDLFLTDVELCELEEDLGRSRNEEKYLPARVNFERRFIYRVFNNESLEEGGRFYGGWWQTIPKAYRPYISINNNFVEELDYSGMHVDLLYAHHNAVCSMDDPYVFGLITHEHRDQTKVIFNRLINVSKRAYLISALEKDHDERKLMLPKDVSNFDEYVGLIESAHSPIAGSFMSGASVKLQYLDSQIAERVMLRMLVEHSAACLPIHDSFVVEAVHVKALRQVMEDVFIDFVGRRPQIKAVSRSLKAADRQDRVNLIGEIFDDSQGYVQRYDIFCRYNNHKYLTQGGVPFEDKPCSASWTTVS